MIYKPCDHFKAISSYHGLDKRNRCLVRHRLCNNSLALLLVSFTAAVCSQISATLEFLPYRDNCRETGCVKLGSMLQNELVYLESR
jgi:hypothetical protein